MSFYVGKRLFLAAAVVAAVAVFTAALFVALAVRSVVAGPSASPEPPNPGHSWSEIGDLPGTMWHSNNDGAGSGLDADLLDGSDASGLGGGCYTNWTGASCATGWTAVYTGVWDAIVTTNFGYLICGPQRAPNLTAVDLVLRVDSVEGDNQLYRPQNDPCALCCK